MFSYLCKRLLEFRLTATLKQFQCSGTSNLKLKRHFSLKAYNPFNKYMFIYLPNVSVQFFSSNGKLPTSVLQATLMSAGGVQKIEPSL